MKKYIALLLAVMMLLSVLAACALVTGQFSEPGCILAGVPAKVVKKEIDWSILRTGVGEIPADFAEED